jgi:hypothetical protein
MYVRPITDMFAAFPTDIHALIFVTSESTAEPREGSSDHITRMGAKYFVFQAVSIQYVQ